MFWAGLSWLMMANDYSILVCISFVTPVESILIHFVSTLDANNHFVDIFSTRRVPMACNEPHDSPPIPCPHPQEYIISWYIHSGTIWYIAWWPPVHDRFFILGRSRFLLIQPQVPSWKRQLRTRGEHWKARVVWPWLAHLQFHSISTKWFWVFWDLWEHFFGCYWVFLVGLEWF